MSGEWPHTADLSDAFFPKLIAIADSLSLKDEYGNAYVDCEAVDLLKVMKAESNVSARAHNPNGHASGLIQWMPTTLAGLHYAGTHEDFRKLTAEQQLDYVEPYFRPWKKYRLTSPARCYLATFMPATLSAHDSELTTFVICGSRGPFAWAYNANKVFDQDKKGYITVGDLGMAIERNCRGDRWDEIVARLVAAKPEPDRIPLPFNY